MGRVGASSILIVVSIVLFVLAGLGVAVGDLTELREVALGLGFFALAHIAP